jgi:hypothetical protein
MNIRKIEAGKSEWDGEGRSTDFWGRGGTFLWKPLGLGRFLASVFLGILAFGRVVADPVIQAEVSGESLKLTVSGDPGASYVLETSTDLKTWSTLDGVSLSGVGASSSVSLAGNAVFYRAKAVGGSISVLPSVKVTLSTNDVAWTVVTPEYGGECQFNAASGVTYTLTFATNAVAEPTLVRMTRVDALDGVPAAQGFLAGVVIEPADLTLIEPASLTIGLTNSYAPLDLAGYGFTTNGADWHLHVSFADTNSLEISLPTLGGVGCGVFTEAEMLALPEPEIPTNFPTARKIVLQTLPEDCYPDEHGYARRYAQYMRTALEVFTEHEAKYLHVQRRGLDLKPTAPLSGTQLAMATRIYASIYADNIVPFLAKGESSCVIGSEILSWSRLLASHARRVGVTDTPWATPSSEFVCKVVKRCKEQARDCCIAGTLSRGQLPREFASADAMAARYGLSGANCGGPKLSDVSRDCAPQWYGHLSVHETHRTVSDNHSSTLRGGDTVESVLSIEADVATSIETLTPVVGQLALHLIGSATGTYNHSGWSWTFWLCDCKAGPGKVLMRGSRVPMDGCPGSKLGAISVTGTNAAASSYDLTLWIPVTNSIPGLPVYPADTISQLNRSVIGNLNATLDVPYSGISTANSTCPEDAGVPPKTPIKGKATLGQLRPSSSHPDEQLFTATEIRWTQSRIDPYESHDDWSDFIETIEYTVRLELHRRSN